MADEPVVRYIEDVPAVPCPCGESTRIITRADTPVANLHVTHIVDARPHYHKHCTEIYHVIEGAGRMELDGRAVELRPGATVVIPPGVVHSSRGGFRTVIVGVPAWEHTDEFFCPP
jgi:mannose-6-phosphate isomerase-like protein (cupin superfamily)